MACHTASMVAPSDPRWRAATVGGFTFGGSDPPYSILAVQAEKDGITTISGELMGKSLSIPHIVVTFSLPTPYCGGKYVCMNARRESCIVKYVTPGS